MLKPDHWHHDDAAHEKHADCARRFGVAEKIGRLIGGRV